MSPKLPTNCRILWEHGGFELRRLIHPKQTQALIGSKPLFARELQGLYDEIQWSGNELIEPAELLARLLSLLQEVQREWLRGNELRASITGIGHDRIHSELVHDIAGPGTLAFSSSTIKGNLVPDLQFQTFFASLQSIVLTASAESANTTNGGLSNEVRTINEV